MGAIQAYKVKSGVTAIILLAVVEDVFSGANQEAGRPGCPVCKVWGIEDLTLGQQQGTYTGSRMGRSGGR